MKQLKIKCILCLLFIYHLLYVLGCEEVGGYYLDVNNFHPESFLDKYQNLGDAELDKFFRIVEQETNAENTKQNLKYYASIDHMAGSAGDFHLARFTRDKMRDYGFDSEIVPMKATLSLPINRSLCLLSSDGRLKFTAILDEPSEDFDPTSGRAKQAALSFLAYSASGDVKGNLIYANYGRPIDYEVLDKAGVSVKGRIVIVRYGECFRGLKIMNAGLRGALGVIIYSDPHEDGFTKGDVYPIGPWRPSYGVQRGSAQYNSLVLGDPYKDNVEEITGYTSDQLVPIIPALPISYSDAIPLLKSLKGPLASSFSSDFVGALGTYGVQYRLGPSQDIVSLKVKNKLEKRNIWNVISILKSDDYGSELDQPIVIGNHHDAWVFGAADPNSGSSVVLETARVLGLLRKQFGWKPRRSVVFGSWSGEEHGLIGSTAWAEKNKNGILKNAAAYLNVDIGISGPIFLPGSSSSLANVLVDAISHVPGTGWNGKLGTLGSGSDYAVFLDNVGIPSMDLRFGQPGSTPGSYGTYHSVFDSYHYIESVVDPDFKYHVMLSKILTISSLALSSQEILPLNLLHMTQTLLNYVDEVENLPFRYATMLKSSIKVLNEAVEAFNRCNLSIEERNRKLGLFERCFIVEEGLPKRKNFKSVLQCPALYLGYAAEIFPGLTQVIREQNSSAIEDQVQVLLRTFSKATEHLSCF